MRVEATAVTMSWIPSDSLKGALKAGMDLRLSHWDAPLPDRVQGAEEVNELSRHDKFRFANVLSVWAEVEDGQHRGCGPPRQQRPGDGLDDGEDRPDRRHVPGGLDACPAT